MARRHVRLLKHLRAVDLDRRLVDNSSFLDATQKAQFPFNASDTLLNESRDRSPASPTRRDHTFRPVQVPQLAAEKKHTISCWICALTSKISPCPQCQSSHRVSSVHEEITMGKEGNASKPSAGRRDGGVCT
mmetsp:Transcript_5817/g.18944  ORF Transcript_5817/g.18944 Transcript_5817/m.18944 type:complete len:132 (+) Transcript_5817:1273-1668(+)